MAVKPVKLVSFYLKALAAALIVVFCILDLYLADTLARRVTAPLTAPVCCETPADFGAAYQPMHFQTADGLLLSGWYIPPRNGAVIILLHAYYADRRQTLPVARMLYTQGYGLLMYDQRASGESQGQTRSLGWQDIPDVRAAAGWLAEQPGNLKIGAYGCSTGGAIALAGSAGTASIQAMAVDAPSPLQWYENLPQFSLQDPFNLPVMALYYPLVMLHSQSLPPISTTQAVQAAGAKPILFISSGLGEENARVNSYFESAQGPKERWNIPEAAHCGGPTVRPQEYQKHLLDFFKTALR